MSEELDAALVERVLRGVTSTSGVTSGFENAATPGPYDSKTGMAASYWVLSEAERGRGFVRPVRSAYRHLKCGATTTMSRALAETYARQPDFYGATYCVRCCAHFPVGTDGEFVWADPDSFTATDGLEKVGT